MLIRKNRIGLFGGDQRIVCVGKLLLDLGYFISTFDLSDKIAHPNCHNALSYSELFNKSSVLIGPIPFSKNKKNVFSCNKECIYSLNEILELLDSNHILIAGSIPKATSNYCDDNSIQYIDLIQNENIAILNAIATAEGTIMEAIKSSSINLHSSKCLIIGYGRCGKILANKLKALDATISITARSVEALSYAYSYGFKTIHMDYILQKLHEFDFIFNTVPALILDKEALDKIKQNCTIIDIASAPGGIDFDYANQINLNAKLCLGLPGKVAPETSAKIIVNEISNILTIYK
ncbi:MAG TPA: dipicolinate synthase subunit DpsA [Clostridiales bacterium]|nr:dipicolinate synthase subunit DpsA [Clostridiales bacterium]